MDEKLEKMVEELLFELDGMPPVKINELRNEWLADLRKRDPQHYDKIAKFVNIVSDVAIERAKRRLAVA